MAEFLATFVPALGQALLHFLWQGALIGLAAAIALRALRHALPQTRYAVACLALAACALAPIATLLAPHATNLLTPLAADPTSTRTFLDAGPQVARTWIASVAPAAGIDPFLPWIVALWAAGTCALSLRMAFGLAWVHRMRHAPQAVAPVAWQHRLDVLADHFGLQRQVTLRIVDELDSPVSAGWWRPVVLLPAALLMRMPVDLIEALLAHELAHIRRHDYLVNLLQNAVEAVLFYHPVTWWLSHRIRIEREQVADRLAAEVACAPRRLALALAELSELQRTGPALQFAQAAHGGHLMSRIEHLVRPARRAHPAGRIVFPLLGLLAAGLCTYTYAQIGQESSEESVVLLNPSEDPNDRDTYALVRKERDGENIVSNLTIGGPHDDLRALESLKRRVAGDFLWIRRDGHDYVVTDPALLARTRQAWREAEAMDQKMEALDAKMEVHSQKMEALSSRMETLSTDDAPSPEARAAERELDALERRQEDLEREQEALADQAAAAEDDGAEQNRIAQKQEALAAKQQALAELQQRQAERIEADARRLEARQGPLEALSREMELASAPMEVLGKQMEALSQEHEKIATRARIETRRLIDEAMARKLAAPVR